MNESDIHKMEDGYVLDAIIAINVMNWHYCGGGKAPGWYTETGELVWDYFNAPLDIFNFSTNAHAALMIVDKIDHLHFKIEHHSDATLHERVPSYVRDNCGKRKTKIISYSKPNPDPHPYWEVKIFTSSKNHAGYWSHLVSARADTFSLAICRAALLTHKKEKEDNDK